MGEEGVSGKQWLLIFAGRGQKKKSCLQGAWRGDRSPDDQVQGATRGEAIGSACMSIIRALPVTARPAAGEEEDVELRQQCWCGRKVLGGAALAAAAARGGSAACEGAFRCRGCLAAAPATHRALRRCSPGWPTTNHHDESEWQSGLGGHVWRAATARSRAAEPTGPGRQPGHGRQASARRPAMPAGRAARRLQRALQSDLRFSQEGPHQPRSGGQSTAASAPGTMLASRLRHAPSCAPPSARPGRSRSPNKPTPCAAAQAQQQHLKREVVWVVGQIKILLVARSTPARTWA